MNAPPRSTIPPIIHKIRVLHKELYGIGNTLPKRDKLGIHAGVETLCVAILARAVEAAFTSRREKTQILEKLRIQIEVLKNLIRTEYECMIIDEKKYLRLAEQLVVISKETSHWLSYTQKGA